MSQAGRPSIRLYLINFPQHLSWREYFTSTARSSSSARRLPGATWLTTVQVISRRPQVARQEGAAWLLLTPTTRL